MELDPKHWIMREQGEFLLINPSHVCAVANASWTPENKWLRSRLEHGISGKVVSQGFGKFFNLGCGPEGLNITFEHVMDACERQDAVATLKLDGSLLIRSVYKGQVMLRTRGSFGTEMLDNHWEIEEVFKHKYPQIFDPSFYPDGSLLFEWVTPNNRIVIRYDEPELILVGAVQHAPVMRYLTIGELYPIAKKASTALVEYFPLATQGWSDLFNTLRENHDIEGYVIRMHGEQSLVKVKCDPYLTKHALKSNLKSEDLADLFFQLGQPSFKDFTRHFEETYDEETAMWAMPAISALYDGVRELNGIVAHMTKLVQKKQSYSRKDFAIEMQQAYGKTKKFSLIMRMFTGQAPDAKGLKSILLQNTKQVEMGIWSAGNDDDLPEDADGQ